ncbi:hypothetical protein [Streptomyces candidus]|uniref:Secreted protein n=1 Tax=Streptomyces candidus TaxID=67283 RepID=A0A7X0LU49_9ACTN|nr:hypothetical protein [Streptomyces candidus]MBB6440084.1 hypothetical protein [Streptomyces candidus]GHH43979.1 hypothetical protein GCM10018773_31180 [Streptomyces candidus]
MRVSRLALVSSLAAASLVGSSFATASAEQLAAPKPSPAVEAAPSVEGSPSTAAAPIGLFVTTGDKVHYSTSKPGSPAAMSGHGWWIKGTTKATKANISIWLEVKSGKGWRVVGSGVKKNAYPGGGSKGRATARMVCAQGPVAPGAKWTYRTRIDVDLTGHADSNEQAVTAPQSYPCMPRA